MLRLIENQKKKKLTTAIPNIRTKTRQKKEKKDVSENTCGRLWKLILTMIVSENKTNQYNIKTKCYCRGDVQYHAADTSEITC